MAGNRFFNVHRSWEDWLGMLLGVMIVLSPWFAGRAAGELPVLNAIAVGAAVLLLAESELVDLHRWEESLELLCGLWLIASPFVFEYTWAALSTWHFVLGGIVTLLAAIELVQDRTLTDQQMAEHGQ